MDSVVLQCSSVRKNQDNLGILQKEHSQHVMYRTLLSYYSHNGPSEKRTENYDRLEILCITNLREAVKWMPLSYGQWTYITPRTARSTYIFASEKQTTTTPTPAGRRSVSVCTSVYIAPLYFAPARVCYVANDLAKEPAALRELTNSLIFCNE